MLFLYIFLGLLGLWLAVILLRAAFFKPKAQPAISDETIEFERQAAIDKQQRTGVPEDAADADDPVLEDAIKVVVELGQASTSLLQRKLKLGYSRAARIIDQMEERGIIGPYEGSKPRQVLITHDQLMEMRASSEE